MKKINENILIQLELNLNGIKFREVPIGGLIVNAIYIELLMGNGDWSVLAQVKDLYFYFRLFYCEKFKVRKNSSYSPNILITKNPALFTFISTRKNIFNINYTSWKRLGERNSICLLNSPGIKKLFSEDDRPNALYPSDLPPLNYIEWYRSFKPIKANLHKILKTFCETNNLPKFIRRRLYNYYLSQTQLMTRYEEFLMISKPRCIVVEYDRFHLTSPLILAARIAKVPSFTLVHGVINNAFGYLPILADYLCCWGSRQKAQLAGFKEGFDQIHDKIDIVGAPQLSNKPSILNKRELRLNLNIKDNVSVIILATNTIEEELRHDLISIFCKAIHMNSSIQGVVRLHPSEHRNFYQEYIERYDEILFDTDGLLDHSQSLAIADVVCIFNSAYGIDAAVKGLPLLIIDVNSDDLGQSKDMIDYGGIPSVRSILELQNVIRKLLTQKEFLSEIKGKVAKYTQEYCFAYGEEASDNLIENIESRLGMK